MHPDFIEKINNAPSRIILHMNPIFELLPLPILRYDDPFLPFAKKIIPATTDLVAGYIFDFASYLSMAGAGVVALERSIALVPKDRVRILHGAFTGKGYSAMTIQTAFDLDAITVATSADQDYYTDHAPYTAFLTTDTEIPRPSYAIAYNRIQYTVNDALHQLTVTTNESLYASKQDDYIDTIRERLLTLQ